MTGLRGGIELMPGGIAAWAVEVFRFKKLCSTSP